MTSQVSGDARTRDAANFCRNQLYRNHQRETEDKCPGQTITEFGANLAMRAYAAGIIICRTCDKARSQSLQEGPKSARVPNVIWGRFIHTLTVARAAMSSNQHSPTDWGTAIGLSDL